MKLKDNVELDKLLEYGFFRPSPVENVWYYNPLRTHWTGGIGRILANLLVHKETREIQLKINKGSFQPRDLDVLGKMIQDGLVDEMGGKEEFMAKYNLNLGGYSNANMERRS